MHRLTSDMPNGASLEQSGIESVGLALGNQTLEVSQVSTTYDGTEEIAAVVVVVVVVVVLVVVLSPDSDYADGVASVAKENVVGRTEASIWMTVAF